MRLGHVKKNKQINRLSIYKQGRGVWWGFFKARRENMIVHTSAMIIGWGGRIWERKNDSVTEENSVGMT